MTKNMTVKEVADELRITPESVQIMCREGRIGATKAGRRWLIPRESLDAYLKIRR